MKRERWYAKDSPEGEWSEERPVPTIFKDIYFGDDKEPTLERIAFPEADMIVKLLNLTPINQ